MAAHMRGPKSRAGLIAPLNILIVRTSKFEVISSNAYPAFSPQARPTAVADKPMK